MSEKIPDEFIEQFNDDRLNNVEVKVEEFPEMPNLEEPEVIDLGEELEEADPLEFIEGDGEGGISQEEAEAFASILVDGVGLAKDELSSYFESQFQQEVQQKFTKEQAKHLNLIIALDQEGDLDIDSVHQLADKYKMPQEDLLQIKVKYAALKKKWQSTEYKEYQKNGIRRNATKVAERYFQRSAPNPVVMLLLYIAVALGGDIARLVKTSIQERKARKEVTSG